MVGPDQAHWRQNITHLRSSGAAPRGRRGNIHWEGMFARCAPSAPRIQINVPAIHPIAPPSYRTWGALSTIAKAQVMHA